MRKENHENILKYFYTPLITYLYGLNRNAMAKKKKPGRPKGSEKEPMNIYIHKERATKLRIYAAAEQKTISTIIENALEKQYGI